MYKFYFFILVKRGEKMSSSEMTTVVFLKDFAANYFATKRYKYGENVGKLCTEFRLHGNKMEDCGNYYLLTDCTVSHEIYEHFDNSALPDYIVMDEKVNVIIRLNKNRTTKEYYDYVKQYEDRTVFLYNLCCLKINSTVKYYNGYSYYPMVIETYDLFNAYLSVLKRFVNEKRWFSNRFSKYYYLVDPELTMDRIEILRQEDEEAQRLREERRRRKEEERRRREEERRRREEEERRRREEERLRRIQEEQRRLAEERRQAEQKVQLAQEKINDEVEKEDLANICALYNDIKDGKIKNMTNSMKKILFSYIANVSENVQFQLQDEIKEIYKELNMINDDLELYIHNI